MDGLGSTFALSNTAGASVVSYSYDSFGKTTITGVSANPFQFTGRENDGGGLYYYRQRYYGPSIERFLSQDPILAPFTPLIAGICPKSTNSLTDKINALVWALPDRIAVPEPGTVSLLNAYLYVQNNPVRYNDPSGLDKDVPCRQERQQCLNEALNYAQTDAQRTCVNGTLGAYCPRSTQRGAVNSCIQNSLYDYTNQCSTFFPPKCFDVQNCSYQQDPLPGRPPGRRGNY